MLDGRAGVKSRGRRADRTSVECVARSFSDEPDRTLRLVVRRGSVRGVDDFVCCVAGFS
jgi:hypothetical protein